jgi:hypothetical protein
MLDYMYAKFREETRKKNFGTSSTLIRFHESIALFTPPQPPLHAYTIIRVASRPLRNRQNNAYVSGQSYGFSRSTFVHLATIKILTDSMSCEISQLTPFIFGKFIFSFFFGAIFMMVYFCRETAGWLKYVNFLGNVCVLDIFVF